MKKLHKILLIILTLPTGRQVLRTVVLLCIGVILLIPLLGGVGGGFCFAQNKKLTAADNYFEVGDYRQALEIYLEIYDTDSLDILLNYNIGISKFNLPEQRKQSKRYFEKVIKLPSAPTYKTPEAYSSFQFIDAYYYMGRIYHLELQFDEAIKMYEVYKNYNDLITFEEFAIWKEQDIDRYIEISLTAKEMIFNPVEVTVENAGAVINSTYPDYAPVISADESVLMFTSRRPGSTGGLLDAHGQYFEDIYISYNKDGVWTAPEQMPSPINTKTNDAVIGLSVDGQMLFIYRTNEDLTGGDIYISDLQGEKWSRPGKLAASDVNTENLEPSACLSADGKTLYFSSNRPGGYGGKDIYRVVQLPGGLQSLALNLGPTINTHYDEDAPFIHPDGKTLYFSSKGHKNMGGYDVFKSVLDEDAVTAGRQGLWSKPENLGSPINSVGDDIYFVLSANGERGYFSSLRDKGIGNADIYVVNMPYEPGFLMVIKGIVASSITQKPIKSTITIIDNVTRGLQGVYKSNSATGKYIMIFSPKRKYKMIVEAEDYYTYTEEYFIVSHLDTFAILTKDIYLEPVNKETEVVREYIYTYTLENVYFDSKKHELLPESYSAFMSLVRAMETNPRMKIEIAGHTDNVGDEESNLELSQKRQNSVRDYLINKGIAPDRLTAKGYGETQPIASNDTEEGRAKNRRTEVRVIEE